MNQPPVIGFSISDICAAYGVSTSTVRRWIRQGLRFVQPIPHGRVFIRQQDLDAFLQPQQQVTHAIEHLMNEILGEIQENAGQGPSKT